MLTNSIGSFLHLTLLKTTNIKETVLVNVKSVQYNELEGFVVHYIRNNREICQLS